MKPKQITVPDYAELTGFSVIKIYSMIDASKIKATKKKGERTMIVL